MLNRLLDLAERASAWPTIVPMRLRWQIVTLIAVLALLGCAARAQADTLVIGEVHYLAASGAIAATVTATGPQNTDIAISLYRSPCPARPAESDFTPGASADGIGRLLLANPPAPGQTGTFYLCVWLVHADQTVGARYQQAASLPAQPPSAWNPSSGTDHPLWWPFAGWAFLAASTGIMVLACLAGLGMLRRAGRWLRGRSGRGHGIGGEDDREMLAEWRMASAQRANPFGEGATIPMAPPPPAGWPGEGSAASAEVDAILATPGPARSTEGYPFLPPQAPRPEPGEQPPSPQA